jgi:hypothetical protein
MRIIGLAIAMIATIAAPGLALAAAGPTTVSKEARAKGMAEAPALVSATGSDCQVSDARIIGTATDPKTKVKTTVYEVACTGSEGLLVMKVDNEPTAQTFTCLEAASAAESGNKNANQCILPANLDPKAGILPFLAKTGVTCTVDKARALGHSPTAVYFEVACHEGAPGYILTVSSPPRLDKPVTAQPCLMFDPASNVHCELTDRATQMSVVDRLTSQSGKPCAIKDRGWIGVAPSGKSYYEVACQDGKGYVLEEKADGGFGRAIDCVEADAIAGGCKLTDTRQAKTEQSGLYSKLAKEAGFNCTVSGYAPFSIDMPGKEVVELACSNRPDGGIAVFPVSGGTGGVIYDCAHSELKSLRCSLTKASAAYPSLTADLKRLGKSTCTVSESRVVGVSADQRGYIEVGCSDGLPGYMIVYEMATLAPKTTLVCAEAKGISGGCTLPGNAK